MLKRAFFGLLLACSASVHSAPDWTAATVIKTDTARQRLVLKHEAIERLDMPAMTMSYRVTDAAWLSMVPKQTLRIQVEKVGGTYTVVGLEAGPVPPAAP